MRSLSPASRHLPRGSAACRQSASIDDMFRLMMEIRDDVAHLRSKVVDLRCDVRMVQVGLGDFYTEVVAIRGDIVGLRGTSEYRDGVGGGGTGGYQDGEGDGGTGGYRDGGGDGGTGGCQGRGG
ncbi:glycine-rich RNA-binding protein-like [Olea europaea var. sylvestris]|uniref:glycine-rich RNA-binding protein-like n=1 Tax=Olea europaea var. sylvestris TaxID=158386 RepID=UPI000C1D7721|nr:glycine-rich RNA-binding protein-like [Olea europaea var. sylvestris]